MLNTLMKCAVGKMEVFLLILHCVCFSLATQNGLAVRDFLGFPSLQEVECGGGSLSAEVELLMLTLYKRSDNSVLAVVNPLKNTCLTFGDYSSCSIHTGDPKQSVARTLVSELEEGEGVVLGCNATSFMRNGHPQVHSWFVSAYRRKTTTTSTTTTTTTTTTVRPARDTKTNVGGQPKHLSVQKGTLKEFYVPPLVLIVGLCLIVFLALLSMVLIILQCRRSGRRKRRTRAANRESLLSAKSEQAGCSSSTKDLDLGCTTYRATRSFPTFAPGPPHAVPPPQAGQLGAMRYQKGAPDDTGYVSGSSNHYSEPYACHEEGTQERTRSAPRPGLPQIKGSPQPPRLPDNHP